MNFNDSFSGPVVPTFSTTVVDVIFGVAPFGDKEIAIYNLFVGGDFKTEVQYVMDMKEEKGQKCCHIISLLGKTEVLDSEVMFNAHTYVPMYSKKVLHLAAGKIEATVVYGQRQANIHLLLPHEEHFSLDYHEAVYDNEQIIHLIRALSFEQRSEASFRYLYPFAKHIQTAFVRLIGKEIMTVESGEYVCYNVELIIPGQRILLWYAENHPHQMIRYQADTSKMILELKQMRSDNTSGSVRLRSGDERMA